MRNAMGMAESMKRMKRNLVEQTAMAVLCCAVAVFFSVKIVGLWVKAFPKL